MNKFDLWAVIVFAFIISIVFIKEQKALREIYYKAKSPTGVCLCCYCETKP